jgi:hypothetical protein
MGMFLKTIVAFCVGAGMLIAFQQLWMSSITSQIRAATAYQLPQAQFKPTFNSIDTEALRKALNPGLGRIDTSIGQRLAIEGAARRIDIQIRNAQSAVPVQRRFPGMPR